ncbi:galactokinase [Eubacteriales bacterium OttesenSCG-928-N13]|nr:galactokinase [Eubacteriales bacterium OttesenSCG-928-N13]
MNARSMLDYLGTEKAIRKLSTIYGDQAAAQAKRYQELAFMHERRYGDRSGLVICSAPGRTEIAGNHTDHQRGRVLAAAVDLDTLCAATPNAQMRVTLWSDGYQKPFIVDLNDLDVHEDEKETTLSLIRGVASRMQQLGYKIGGFDAEVSSTVFKGSGLSSSAAFEVMLVSVFDALFNGFKIDAQTRAVISQYAENEYFGKPSGLLDQMASSVGGLVTMDFREEKAKIEALSYDFAAKGYVLCVVAAGGDHGNLTNEYAAIPKEMREVAEALGGKVLTDIKPDVMEQKIPVLKGKVSDRAILRALHFYDEDQRIPQLVEAIKQDQLPEFLALIVASGDSSQRLLQNLYVPGRDNQEMTLALELSRRMLEKDGAWRIHGGGFAGTILAFVPKDALDAYRARMDSVFGEGATTVLSVRPVGPAVIGLQSAPHLRA